MLLVIQFWVTLRDSSLKSEELLCAAAALTRRHSARIQTSRHRCPTKYQNPLAKRPGRIAAENSL